ncbi:MAG: bifunctional folylpolyglutamate synthase/dihydrofolate synthase [Methanomassiliicoccales archaeon]|nr:bifunctional folylpolyglutamate synthase/dihydrofolate synthase [Methanomassiliicoccales archaeon]MDD1755591.1 bifunctional folylpolyglutamate synthase/dihydrofolate synthase [Methanomassiliicoccales archaeon]
MEYQEALDWLLGLETMGIKLGLSNVKELLSRLDDPQDQFRSVHVAGTNGKGSVSAMTASILRSQGYRTALYTSPHMFDFRERIQVDGTPISRKQLCRLVQEIKGHFEDMRRARPEGCPTFFEVTTALAFLHFAELGAEVAVVEVGMGGRLDATNVIIPECSAITRIGLEHTRYLGDTIGKIAFEKAGIIKPGIPVVTAEQSPDALGVIRSRAMELCSPLRIVAEGVDFKLLDSSLQGTKLVLLRNGMEVSLPLIGSYQASNACLAFAVVESLRGRGMAINDEAVRKGLETVRWPGRMELVGRHPDVIFDATHTPQGAEVVAEELHRLVPGRIFLVMGVLDDKDLEGVVAPFAQIAWRGYAASPLTQRAFSPLRVQQAMSKHMTEVEIADSVVNGLCKALREAGPEDTIVVTGSIYTLGEAKAWWDAHEGC